jgi:hypothetical protein
VDVALRLAGWFLSIVGILWAIYGGSQVVLGAILAIQGPERTPHLMGAVGGALLVGVAALITHGGRRLRKSASAAARTAR